MKTASIQMLNGGKMLSTFCESPEKDNFQIKIQNALIKGAFYGMFRIFWNHGDFSNELWKIRFLLCEMGPCLFAFEKHLYTYGNKFEKCDSLHHLDVSSHCILSFICTWVHEGIQC
jgi:hypothetical protein